MDAHKKKVHCQICDKDFSGQDSLRVHKKTKHTDQSTPEAIARRLKHNTDTSRRRRERRATDPIYREKMQTNNRIERSNKNARKAAKVHDVEPKDVSTLVDGKTAPTAGEPTLAGMMATGRNSQTSDRKTAPTAADPYRTESDSEVDETETVEEKKRKMEREADELEAETRKRRRIHAMERDEAAKERRLYQEADAEEAVKRLARADAIHETDRLDRERRAAAKVHDVEPKDVSTLVDVPNDMSSCIHLCVKTSCYTDRRVDERVFDGWKDLCARLPTCTICGKAFSQGCWCE
jgi:hypothetical protein